MSLHLGAELFQWLCDYSVLEEIDVTSKEEDRVVLTEGATSHLFDGTKISGLLCRLGEEKGITSNFSFINRPNSSSFSQAALRVYNWSNISKDLVKHSIVLSADMRSLITAGDSSVLCELLSSLKAASQGAPLDGTSTSLSTTLAQYLGTEDLEPITSEEPVNTVKPTLSEKIILKTSLLSNEKTIDFTEELMKSITRHLEIPTSEAVRLFEDPSTAFRPLVIAGKDGDHSSMEAWLKHVYMLLETFPFTENSFSIQFLQFVSTAYKSPSLEVVRWVSRILTNFKIAASFQKQAYLWFVNHCLREVIRNIMLPHQEHISFLTATLMHFSRGSLKDLLTDSGVELRFLSKIVPHMRNNFSDESEMQECIGHLLDLGLPQTSGTKDTEVQDALQFLCHVWSEFPDNVAKLEEQSEKIIQEFRKKCRQQSTSTKMCCILCMFRLLDVLMTRKNKLAPQIYKCLVFLLIESNGEQQIRDLITSNFTAALKKLPGIPPQVVIEPLVREISLEGYTNLDLEFVNAIATHPRLPVKHALLLTHMLGKIALNDPVFARLAMIPFLTLIARFHTKPIMQDYVEKFCKVAVSMFLKSVERAYSSSGLEDSIDTNKIRERLSLEVVQKICQMKISIYAQRMMPCVRIVRDEYVRIFQKEHPELEDISGKLQAQINAVTPVGIMSQFPVFPPAQATTAVAPQAHPPVPVAKPSQAEIRARELLQSQLIVPDTTEIDPKLLAPAEDDRQKIIELTKRHDEQIRLLHEKEVEILREQANQIEELRQREAEVSKRRQHARLLEEEKYQNMREFTQSPEYQSPRKKNRPAKLISARSQKRKKAHEFSFTGKTLGHRKKNDKYKFFVPWTAEVKKLITVTYERPITKIFNMFKGNKPRTQKMQSFDELAKSKQCLGTGDFLHLFESFTVCPDLISKHDLMHICKEVSTSGGRLVSMSEFFLVMWYVSMWIYRDKHDPMKKVTTLLNYMKEETLYNTKLNKKIWILEKKRRKTRKARAKSLSKSPPQSPTFIGSSLNRAQKEREAKKKEERRIRKKREKRFRERDALVKQELEMKREEYEMRKREQQRQKRDKIMKQKEKHTMQESKRKRRQKEIKQQLQQQKENLSNNFPSEF